MNLKDCYNAMYADYEGVMSRLLKEERVIGYLRKFTEDKSFAGMLDAIYGNDYTTAINEAITLAGICDNLGLKLLSKSLEPVLHMLRNRTVPELLDSSIEKLKMEYEHVINVIKSLDDLDDLDD